MSKQKTVLVADVEEGIKVMEEILGKEVNVIGADTLAKATALLSEDIHLIVCSIHFSDSCMFDFLRVAKANPETKKVPFFCLKIMESDLNPLTLEAVSIACRSLGAVGFWDFLSISKKYGIKEAEAQLKSLLIELMLPNHTREIL